MTDKLRMGTTIPAQPDVLLLIATGCSICPVVHKILAQLKQDGRIGKFDVVNITEHPDLAVKNSVRSVPWFRIGELEFQGMHSATELEFWTRHALSDQGVIKYLIEELEAGHLPAIEQQIRKHPDWLRISLSIIADMESPIQARIGLGAIIEGLQGDPMLQTIVPELSHLSRHNDPRVRGDACYYLGLSSAAAARPALSTCAEDPNPEVREIAQEALAALPN